MKSSAQLFSMLLGACAVVWVARAASAPTPKPAKLEGKIAFTSNSRGTHYIYVMNADASSYQDRLTLDHDGGFEPSFSQDGKKIAFSRAHNGMIEIWIMNADGTAPICLFTNGIQPNLSPNGKKVAFISYKNDNRGVLTVMSTDGSHHLTSVGVVGNQHDPCFSPDGQRLVFTVARQSGREIWVMNVDGTHRTQLTDGLSRQSSPCFSLDGERIAFASERSGTLQIWIMNAAAQICEFSPRSNLPLRPAFRPMGRRSHLTLFLALTIKSG